MKRQFFYSLGFSILLLLMYSCENELHIIMPQGPKGADGASAYEVWVQAVKDGTIDWDANRIDITNYFLYLKGQDGKDGQNGNDGKSAYQLWLEEVAKGIENPHCPGEQWSKDRTSIQDFWYFLTGAKGQDGSIPAIGENGNWFIDGNDTGIPAKGRDGGSSMFTIGDNGNWFIDGNDTGIPAKGKDGSSSVTTIGENGNWFIDGMDTGIPASGQSSVVAIGENGNWFIDGIDTGVPAFGQNGKDGKDGKDGQDGKDGKDGQNGKDGQDGKNGSNGKSAYELWVEEVAKGIEDPHNPGQQWPKDKTSTSDFWDFLRGKDGQDGKDGKDGKDGDDKKLEDDRILIGKPNVLPQSVAPNYDEFVTPEDGSVRYRVYDSAGDPAPGAETSFPGISGTFTADKDGYFKVEKKDLPVNPYSKIVASVTYNGKTEASAANTEVPAKMRVRIRLQGDPLLSNANNVPHIAFHPVVERSVDGGAPWQSIPGYLSINSHHGIKAYKCSDPDDVNSYNTATYTTSNILPTSYNNQIDVTKNDYTVRVNRLRKVESYNPALSTDPWDGNDNHYFTLIVDGTYYGETLQLNAVIKMAPVQGMPLIKGITASGWNETEKVFVPIKGEFDKSNIDPDLMFKPALKAVDKVTHIYYEPEKAVEADYNGAQLRVAFGTVDDSSPTVLNPSFSIFAAPVSVNVSLTTTSHYFYSLNTIGRFRFMDGVEDPEITPLMITKNNAYNYDDIPVTYIK